jgi:hypothetical protein
MEQAILKAIDRLIELKYISVNELVTKESLVFYFTAEIEMIRWRTMQDFLKK